MMMRKGESKVVTVAAVMVIIALVIVGVIYLQNKGVSDNLSQLRFNEVYRQLSGH